MMKLLVQIFYMLVFFFIFPQLAMNYLWLFEKIVQHVTRNPAFGYFFEP
jgi:hypothetical protein